MSPLRQDDAFSVLLPRRDVREKAGRCRLSGWKATAKRDERSCGSQRHSGTLFLQRLNTPLGEEFGKLLLEYTLQLHPSTEYLVTAKREGEVCWGKLDQDRREYQIPPDLVVDRGVSYVRAAQAVMFRSYTSLSCMRCHNRSIAISMG
jgi:hypothetical protein